MTGLHRWRKDILLGLLGLALGAGLTAAAHAQGAEVRFVPGDRFTSVGGSPLALLVGGGSAPLDRKSLDELAGRLALATWPEGQPVAGRAQVQALASDWTRAQITFVPAAALSDRWYRLRADLPAGFQAEGAPPAGDGAWGVRFRPGAQLVVRRLRACREGQDLRFDVTFSERVRSQEWRGAVAVSQAGARLDCAPIDPEPPVGESKDRDFGAGEIAFHCALPSGETPIDVALGRTLVSLSGVAAGGPEEALDLSEPLAAQAAADGPTVLVLADGTPCPDPETGALAGREPVPRWRLYRLCPAEGNEATLRLSAPLTGRSEFRWNLPGSSDLDEDGEPCRRLAVE